MMDPDDRARSGSQIVPDVRDRTPESDLSATGPGDQGRSVEVDGPPQAGHTISGLFDHGRHLFRRGRLQQAIHVWTRILFLDRNNRPAREAIEQAKKVIAERQRELDALVLEAARREAEGDRRGAKKRLSRALALDPRHAEGRSLWDKIEEVERRGEARSGSLSVVGLVGKPSEEDLSLRPRRRVTAHPVGETVEAEPASSLKMAAFLFSALSLFAVGGLYLHLNWDFLVSDGQPSSRLGSEIHAVNHGALPLPPPSELHYFNGARLFAKGMYKDALSELALVDRENPNFEEARRLILRIEGRLLRGVVMAEVPEDSSTANGKGE
jgi:tetratricopeptide (TPR) repeat protein